MRIIPGIWLKPYKSNVFDVVAVPLHKAGFTVLNTGLVDYPGRYNQKAYREKIAKLAQS